MSGKSVSVIIPTYNRWPVVKTAIDSVLNQNYKNLVCTVVDDCSTDGSFEKISEEYSGRVSVHKMEKNRGQSVCRNFGAEMTNSEFISFLDSDDFFYKDAVSVRMSLFDNGGASEKTVAFGVFNTAGKSGEALVNKKQRGEKLSASEYVKCKVWCQNNGFIVRKKDFFKAGAYNANLRNKEDIELILKLMSVCEFRHAGKLIGEVRNICAGSRQRERHDIVIAQGNRFTDCIRANEQLMSMLGETDFLSLLREENEGILRALYKYGEYKEFREKFRNLSKNNLIGKKGVFFRRYIVSYFMRFLNKGS